MANKSLTYFEIDLPRCLHTYGSAPCAAVQGFCGADGELAADFDGSNDYITRGAVLTGSADSGIFTFSVWFVADALSGRIISGASTLAGATERGVVVTFASSKLNILATNSSGTTILDVSSSALSTGVLYHAVGSFDLSNAAKRFLYINDASDLATVTTYTVAGSIDFTNADWSVGAEADGSNKFNGRIGEVWFAPGQYVKLDVERKRRKFITQGGSPVALGSTGATPTGTQPLVFLSTPTPATTFATNKGSGGALTLTGALTEFTATGCHKCFNSPATCQDLTNFSTGDMRVFERSQYIDSSASTAHPVPMPTTVAVGDLLLCIFVNDNSTTVTTPSGWTAESSTDGTGVRLGIYSKDAAGTEGGTTVDFVTSATETAAAHVIRILASEWSGNIADVEVGTATTATSTSQDPPSLTPSWGGGIDNLYIAVVGSVEPRLLETFPLLFSEPISTISGSSISTSNVGVGSCWLVSQAKFVDPSAFKFTLSVTAGVANTIVIKPATVTPTTMRFSRPAEYNPKDIDAFSCIMGDPDYSPGSVSLGGDVGVRASLTVTFADAHHSDAGSAYDPYLSTRIYDPYELGTHWSKFRARWPGLQGAPCRLYRGFVGDSLASMEAHNLFVETTSGPSVDGVFSITAKDALKFLDSDRALAPKPSRGRLASAGGGIGTGSTTDSLDDTGIGEEYSAYQHVAIGGNEIATMVKEGNTDSVSFDTRGLFGTADQSHAADDRIQVVKYYAGVDVAYIIADLLINHAGLPSKYIPIADWVAETGAFLNQVYTTVISEPTSVNTLVSELVEQAGLALWWDDSAQLLRLQVLRSISSTADQIDAGVFVEKTLGITEQPSKRVSRALTFFGRHDATQPVDDENNYRSVVVTIDADAELKYGGVPAIKKIHSRWIADGGLTVAARLNEILLQRFSIPPRKFTFKTFRGGAINPKLGSAYQLSAWPLQDSLGDPASASVQVTSVRPDADMDMIVAEEQNIDALSGLGSDVVTISSSTANVDLQALHDLIYPAAVSGDTVTCNIGSGVIVSSNSSSTPAFQVGSFASGVTVNITNNGTIVGKGGRGGDGGDVYSGNGDNGKSGGVGLYTRKAATLTNNGTIGGGGGGGGGGGAGGGGSSKVNTGAGGGGGGGAGYGSGGNGGDGGTNQEGKSGENGSVSSAGAGGAGGNGAGGAPDGGDGDNGGGQGLSGSGGASGGGGGGSGGSGGSAGNAVDGTSFITYAVAGTINGNQVN